MGEERFGSVLDRFGMEGVSGKPLWMETEEEDGGTREGEEEAGECEELLSESCCELSSTSTSGKLFSSETV